MEAHQYITYDKQHIGIDENVGTIGREISRMLPNSSYVGMGTGRISLKENSGDNLYTNGIANCKGIVLVFQNTETLEKIYTLEHCPPDSHPDFSMPKGCILIGKHWFDGPASNLRDYSKNKTNKENFLSLPTNHGSNDLKIKRSSDTGLFNATSISIRINPGTNEVIILEEY